MTCTIAENMESILKRIPNKTLTTMKDVMALIAEQDFDPKINRFRSSFLYRGLPDASYHMLTTLQRNSKDKQSEVENSILRNFAKYAVSEDPQINESVWRQMVIGQHHGLPTRLMDWSYSPLVALHFATSGEDMKYMDAHDCSVWKIDIDEIHRLLPSAYQEVLNGENAHLFTVPMLAQVTDSLEKYDRDMKDKSLVLLEPPSIDQRIVNQYSYFSVMPCGITCMEAFLADNTKCTVRYTISKELRWQVRDMLDKSNMNERTMFPGLDGLTAWMKRHYYVK